PSSHECPGAGIVTHVVSGLKEKRKLKSRNRRVDEALPTAQAASIMNINRDFQPARRNSQQWTFGVPGSRITGMVNMSDLSNKVAIVTGASKGIGGGIA